MAIQRTDIAEPVQTVRSGTDDNGTALYDLQAVTGDELVAQRVVRGLLTAPGDIVHRPDWGAGLLAYQNDTPTPGTQQRLLRDASRFLDGLAFVDDYSVTVQRDGDSLLLNLALQVDGEQLEIPQVTI